MQRICPVEFWVSSWMGHSTTSFLQWVVLPHCNIFSPCIYLEFAKLLLDWLAFSFCCASPRKVWLHRLYTILLGSWREQLGNPVTFFSLDWINPSVSVTCAPAPLSFWWASIGFINNIQFINIFLVLQSPSAQYSIGSLKQDQWVWGAVITSLDLLAVQLLMLPSMWLAFTATRAIAPSCPSLLFTDTSRGFSTKLLFKQSAPGCWMGLFYPRCRTLHLPLLNWKTFVLFYFSSLARSQQMALLPLRASVAFVIEDAAWSLKLKAGLHTISSHCSCACILESRSSGFDTVYAGYKATYSWVTEVQS